MSTTTATPADSADAAAVGAAGAEEQAFRVHLEVFEGPLELLLTLVRRESLDITRVALARVTDSFLRYMEALEAIDPGVLADFCETAAALMVYKSRALLPREGGDIDDDEIDPDELVARLRAYKHYRAMAQQLGQRERSGMRAYARLAQPVGLPPPATRGDVPPEALAEAFRTALAEAEAQAAREEPLAPDTRPPRVRLVERFDIIRGILLERESATFAELVIAGRPQGVAAREFVVVSFLALLELLRRWAVVVRQDELFGEIVIEARPALATVASPGEEGSFSDAMAS